MTKFNNNLNNLFKNYQQQNTYAKYQKASSKDKKNYNLWKSADVTGDKKIDSKDKSKLDSTKNSLLKNGKLFDVNGDGKLNQADIDMFVKGDVNGDGKITKEELNFISSYKSSMKSAFTKAKADYAMDGKKYVKGALANGVVDGKYYKNGVLASGTVNGKYYNKGILANGTINGKFYNNGVLANGVVNGKYYRSGVLTAGVVTSPVLGQASGCKISTVTSYDAKGNATPGIRAVQQNNGLTHTLLGVKLDAAKITRVASYPKDGSFQVDCDGKTYVFQNSSATSKERTYKYVGAVPKGNYESITVNKKGTTTSSKAVITTTSKVQGKASGCNLSTVKEFDAKGNEVSTSLKAVQQNNGLTHIMKGIDIDASKVTRVHNAGATFEVDMGDSTYTFKNVSASSKERVYQYSSVKVKAGARGSAEWLEKFREDSGIEKLGNYSIKYDKLGRISTLTPHNESGQPVISIGYADDGSFKIVKTDKTNNTEDAKYYDKNGNFEKAVETSTNPYNGEITQVTSTYNDDGTKNITTELRDKERNLISTRVVLEKSVAGKVVILEESYKNEQSGWSNNAKYAYDDRGNQISYKREEFQNGQLSWVSKVDSEYNENGKLTGEHVAEYRVDKDGNETLSYKYDSQNEYYDNGNLKNTWFSQTYEDGAIYKGATECREDGSISYNVATQYDAEGLRVSDIERKYDEKGMLVSENATQTVKPGMTNYVNGLEILNTARSNASYSYTIDAQGHMELNASDLDIKASSALIYHTNEVQNEANENEITLDSKDAQIAKIPYGFWGQSMQNLTINGDNNRITGSKGDDNIVVNGNNNYVDLLDGIDTLQGKGENFTINNVENVSIESSKPKVGTVEFFSQLLGINLDTKIKDDVLKEIKYDEQGRVNEISIRYLIQTTDIRLNRVIGSNYNISYNDDGSFTVIDNKAISHDEMVEGQNKTREFLVSDVTVSNYNAEGEFVNSAQSIIKGDGSKVVTKKQADSNLTRTTMYDENGAVENNRIYEVDGTVFSGSTQYETKEEAEKAAQEAIEWYQNNTVYYQTSSTFWPQMLAGEYGVDVNSVNITDGKSFVRSLEIVKLDNGKYDFKLQLDHEFDYVIQDKPQIKPGERGSIEYLSKIMGEKILTEATNIALDKFGKVIAFQVGDTQFDINYDPKEGSLSISEIFAVNKTQGKKIERIYNENNKIIYTNTTSLGYDTYGNVRSSQTIKRDSKGKIIERKIETFTYSGKILRASTTRTYGANNKISYLEQKQYNGNGQLSIVQQKNYYENGELFIDSKTRYSKEGNEISLTYNVYNTDGSYYTRVKSDYTDGQAGKDVTTGYDAEGNITYIVEDNFLGDNYPFVGGWGYDEAQITLKNGEIVMVETGDKAVIKENGTVVITCADGKVKNFDAEGREILVMEPGSNVIGFNSTLIRQVTQKETFYIQRQGKGDMELVVEPEDKSRPASIQVYTYGTNGMIFIADNTMVNLSSVDDGNNAFPDSVMVLSPYDVKDIFRTNDGGITIIGYNGKGVHISPDGTEEDIDEPSPTMPTSPEQPPVRPTDIPRPTQPTVPIKPTVNPEPTMPTVPIKPTVNPEPTMPTVPIKPTVNPEPTVPINAGIIDDEGNDVYPINKGIIDTEGYDIYSNFQYKVDADGNRIYDYEISNKKYDQNGNIIYDKNGNIVKE